MVSSRGDAAEAAIIIRAVNEASEELEQIQQDTDATNESMFGFSRAAIGAGLAALGLSFGLDQLIDASSESARSQASLQGTIKLLAPGLEAVIDEMEPHFERFADAWALTQSEVEGVVAEIIRNAGDAIGSTDDLAQAMLATAIVAGIARVDMETAAAAVGQAFQGNMGPLNDLLDETGRNVVELSDLFDEDLVEAAADSVTELDKLKARFGRVIEGAARLANHLLENPLDWETWLSLITNPIGALLDLILEAVPALQDGMDALQEWFNEQASKIAERFIDGFFDPLKEFFTETLPKWLEENVPDFLRPGSGGFLGGFFGVGNDTGGDGSSTVHVVINGNVDSPERAAEFARQVNRQLRETNRRGVNVSA